MHRFVCILSYHIYANPSLSAIYSDGCLKSAIATVPETLTTEFANPIRVIDRLVGYTIRTSFVAVVESPSTVRLSR